MKIFDDVIGFDKRCVVHYNDSSAKPLRSCLDRHTHIGLGEIGRKGLENLVNDPRFDDLPCILETPKVNGKVIAKNGVF